MVATSRAFPCVLGSVLEHVVVLGGLGLGDSQTSGLMVAS